MDRGSVSDEQLVKKAKTGDQRAFEVLVRKYQQRIFADQSLRPRPG